MSTSELAAFHWFQTMLAARRLRAPDGRPLYKYDLKPDEASKLKSLLRRLFVAPVPKTPRLLGAAYCIWTSHWFQKRFCGGPWSWAGAAAPVSAPVDFPNRTHLVIEGMEYLKRPIRTSNGWHEYLHTLISEGGFPNRLISEQRNKWLTRYVEAVTLAASCGDASLAAAIEHASYYQFIVPPAFRALGLFRYIRRIGLPRCEPAPETERKRRHRRRRRMAEPLSPRTGAKNCPLLPTMPRLGCWWKG